MRFAVVLVASLAAASARADDLFLVLPPEDFGAVPANARQIGDDLYASLVEKGLALVPAAQVKTLRAELNAACSTNSNECAKQIGARSGAQVVIWSALYDITDGGLPTHSLDLQVFDVRGGSATAAKQQNKDVRELARWATSQVMLLAPAPVVMGALLVTGPAGVEVFADGVGKARLPMETPLRLSPGRHEVELRAAGATAWGGTVDIIANETLELKRCIKAGAVVVDCGTEPQTDPEAVSPLVIGGAVGVGVGVVGIVVASVAGIATAGALDDYSETPQKDLKPAQVDGVLLTRNVAIGAGVVGGVCLAAGVGVLVASLLMTESP